MGHGRWARNWEMGNAEGHVAACVGSSNPSWPGQCCRMFALLVARAQHRSRGSTYARAPVYFLLYTSSASATPAAFCCFCLHATVHKPRKIK